MQAFSESQDIKLEVPVVDAEGLPYTEACLVKYILTDSDQEKLTDGELASVINKAEITIPKQFNTVPEGQVKDIRFLTVRFSKIDGAYLSTQKIEYLINNDDPLVVGQNSFVTLEKFKLLASTTAGLTYVSKANDEEIVNALVESYERLSRLRYRLSPSMRQEHVGYVSEVAWRPRAITDDDPLGLLTRSFRLQDITPESYSQLPEKFRNALAKAQVVECDAVLAPTDTIEERRRKGVILETINEVKMMFSATMPIRQSVSSKTLSILSPYLDRSIRLARV